MAYPDGNGIQSAAGNQGVDLTEMYAYAGVHAIIPANRSDLFPFEQDTQSMASAWNLPVQMIYGFEQAKGGRPPDRNTLITWMESNGFWSPTTNQLTGNYPTAGQGYPPGGVVATPVLDASQPATPMIPIALPPQIAQAETFVSTHLLVVGAGVLGFLVVTGKIKLGHLLRL